VFPWLIVAGAQAPFAGGMVRRCSTRTVAAGKNHPRHRLVLAGRDRRPKHPATAGIQVLKASAPATPTLPVTPILSPVSTTPAAGEAAAAAAPLVPDHDMLRRIGEGA